MKIRLSLLLLLSLTACRAQVPLATLACAGPGTCAVSSINGLTGVLTLQAGTNVTITPSGTDTLIISSTASGGGTGTVTSVGLNVPTWASITGTNPITTSGALTINLPPFGASGAGHAMGVVPDPGSSAGTTRFLREDGSWTTPTGGAGTVTSIALTTPSWLTVSGSPITTAGTLSVTATGGQTANFFLATPNGSNGALSPRAIVAADIPTLNQATTGNAATATAIASVPTNCGAGVAATGVAANGNAVGCFTPGTVTHTGTLTSGFFPLGNGAADIKPGIHLDDGITTAAVITSTEPISAPGFTSTGTGASISTGTASNTDLAGEITLSGGTGVYTFAGTYTNRPECFIHDHTSPTATPSFVATNTTLTFTGTGTDVIGYGCIFRN